MSKDITAIVQGWDHDPDQFQVRIIAGDDGRNKLQMRVDLGVIQMELSGRPDAIRPEGFDSLLDYHEAKAQGSSSLDDYRIDSDECAALMREGVQYYHRYLAAFHLRRFDLVARDTTRNLRLFAFVVKHAVNRRDKLEFDRYRPYVTMMRARALSSAAIDRGEHVVALAAVDEGIEGIRAFLREYDEVEDQIECRELGRLLRLRREIEHAKPVGPVDRLIEQLDLAVSLEDYEEAARIRDQISRLKGDSTPSGARAARPS